MASITVRLTTSCSGGNHLTFELSGAASATAMLTFAELLEPFTEEDKAAFVKAIARLVRSGRTNAQAKALLQSGVSVVV